MKEQNNDKIIKIEDSPLIEESKDFSKNAPIKNIANDTAIDVDGVSGYVLSSVKRKRINPTKNKKKSQHTKHKMKKSKKILITILSCILGLCLLVVGTFGFLYYRGRNGLLDKSGMSLNPPSDTKVIDNGNYIFYNGHNYRYKDSMTSILFMGVDKDELSTVKNVVGTGGQADALYLIAIDTDNGVTTTFQISRNTMVDIDLYNTAGDFIRTENNQICLSYAYGDGKETSAENTVRSVRRLFYGLPVAQSYTALDISGISALNDSIGGVTVTSPVTYKDDNNKVVYNEGQTYELHGKDAENFVRSRNHETANYNDNRMARQKAYLNAFIDKTVSMTKSDITTPVTIYNSAKPYMTTNLSAAKVSYLATDLLRKGITSADIQKVPGKDKDGKNYVEYKVDNKKFFKMIVDTFYVQAD